VKLPLKNVREREKTCKSVYLSRLYNIGAFCRLACTFLTYWRVFDKLVEENFWYRETIVFRGRLGGPKATNYNIDARKQGERVCEECLDMGKLLAVCAAIAAYAPVAVADDLNPPPWRGQEGTTYARWEFLTADPNPLPDEQVNPYGQADMSVWSGAGQHWMEVWGGRAGVWPLSGAMEVWIPNQPEMLPYKDIRVQISWAPQAPGSQPLITEKDSALEAWLVDEMLLEPTLEPPPVGENWIHSTFTIHIEPNPLSETVRIDGAVMVDEVVIDTICIPEPATLGLVMAGGLAALRWRSL